MSTIKVISSIQRRRRWSAEEKRAIVEEAEQPGMSISAAARKYDINPNQLFNWRRIMRQGALEAVKKGERFVGLKWLKDAQSIMHEGTGNASVAIFGLKNLIGWRDRQDVNTTNQHTVTVVETGVPAKDQT